MTNVILGILSAAIATGADTAVPALHTAAQVRALSPEQAVLGLPVRLRGVVLGEGPGRPALFIRDATESVYVRLAQPLAADDVQRGDIVEVEGVTDPGGFSPLVALRRLTRIGRGSIPPPRPASFDDLLSGRLDAQWVEVTGIVRQCERIPEQPERTRLDVATGGRRLTVQVHASLRPDSYIDASVRLRGMCVNRHTPRRQMISPVLLVPSGVEVLIEQAPAARPSELPLSSVTELFQFASQGLGGHRVRMRGIALHHLPGEILWLRVGQDALRAYSTRRERVAPGDELDLLGFPSRRESVPVLEDATWVGLASGPAPHPIPLRSMTAALEHDADFVEIDAWLEALRPTSEGWQLTLDWNGHATRAFLPDTQSLGLPAPWPVGSLLRLKGICAAESNDGGPITGLSTPREFQLLLRATGDVQVLRAPPWWTPRRVATMLGATAVLSLFAAGAFAVAGRRRAREQESRRAMAEAELTAMLAERSRIAREIHDTLAQDLGAISMQLELLQDRLEPSPNGIGQQVEALRALVRRSLDEARESIWNMRSQVLDTHDLPEALAGLARQLSEGTETDVRVSVSGPARRLAAVTENNLLRVGQEALVNAMKHARARRVVLRLEYAEKQVRLTVSDDGQGFDPAAPRAAGAGGAGLLGMRERASELRSALVVRSSAGRGTEISLTVPVAG